MNMLTNRSYTHKDLMKMGLVLFFVLTVPLSIALYKYNSDPRSSAFEVTTTSTALEAESGVLSGPVTAIADAQASNDGYIKFGQSQNQAFQPTAPYHATFYYPWFQNPAVDGSGNWGNWDDFHTPPQNWFSNYLPDMNPSIFDPATELYSSSGTAANASALFWQFSKMAEAKIEISISSWWGQGHRTDVAFNQIVSDIMERSDNPYPNLRWALYYEKEGIFPSTGQPYDPPVSEIISDLQYIQANYASKRSLLKIDSRPVVFVYGDATDGCADTNDMVQRWSAARAESGTNFYVVYKVFGGYTSCPNQPDSWHQYAPGGRQGQHAPHSYYVSPGFWIEGGAVTLARDTDPALPQFRSAVSSMVAAGTTWKLIQTWNEWGEGSGVEPAQQVLQTRTPGGAATLNPNGAPIQNRYVDVLNQLLPSLEQGTGR